MRTEGGVARVFPPQVQRKEGPPVAEPHPVEVQPFESVPLLGSTGQGEHGGIGLEHVDLEGGTPVQHPVAVEAVVGPDVEEMGDALAGQVGQHRRRGHLVA